MKANFAVVITLISVIVLIDDGLIRVDCKKKIDLS